jgi:hypothetical protein
MLMRNVRWGWIVIGAFVAELLGIAVLMCIRVLHGYGPFSLEPLSAIGGAAFLAELFFVFALFGWWVARGAHGLVFLNGLLVGIAAVLIYEAAIHGSGQSIPLSVAYLVAHVVKVAGGGVGGWLVMRRRKSSGALLGAA